jgi:hypothetical protein
MPTPPAMDYQFYPTMEECHQNGGFKTTNGINGIQQQQHQIQNNVLPKATTSSSTSSFSSSSNKLANQNSSCNNSSNDSLTDAVHVGGGGAGMNSNKLMRNF